jgi:hypothetical protein
MISLRRIRYSDLDSKQRENYNFSKLSAVLADYGFVTMRLTADWQGADFIAQHVDGNTFLKVQLKGRLHFAKKYKSEDIYIAFPWDKHWYMYPHDELLEKVLATGIVGATSSWNDKGLFHFPKLSVEMLKFLEPYNILGDAAPPP